MNKVVLYLKKELKPHSSLVIACSAGPDSMCLVDLVLSLASEMNWRVIIAHVNHKVRPESEEEEKFIKAYAKQNHLALEVKHFDEYSEGKFKEHEAHTKRYNFFKEVVHKYQADYLLTAHHGDDLIETVLMRITRGSNLKGYSGFQVKEKLADYTVVRPLIFVSKADILKYNQEKQVKYYNDYTNELRTITRNRYRQDILPFLKKEEPNIHVKYQQFSEELFNYDEFVQKYILEKEILVDNYLVINKLKKETEFIEKKAIELLIREVQKRDMLPVSKEILQNIYQLINTKGNKQINLPNNYLAIKDYNYLYIKKITVIVPEFKYIFKDFLYTDKWSITKVTRALNESNDYIRLNSEEIKLPIIIRSRINGDKMAIKNLNGRKKIKDIFIDEKVNGELRKNYPLVCDSNDQILWLPGLKKSQFSKDKSEKYDIILKYEVKK